MEGEKGLDKAYHVCLTIITVLKHQDCSGLILLNIVYVKGEGQALHELSNLRTASYRLNIDVGTLVYQGVAMLVIAGLRKYETNIQK